MQDDINDERSMLPRHISFFLKMTYQERLIIANRRFSTRHIEGYGKIVAKDKFDKEIIDFFTALERNHIAYLIAGGIAVNLYAYSCYTSDLDILVGNSVGNKVKLNKSLKDIGLDPVTPQLSNGLKIDIIEISKDSFEDYIKTAVSATIKDFTILILGMDAITAYKSIKLSSVDFLENFVFKEIKCLMNH